jgi:hypothetical protein
MNAATLHDLADHFELAFTEVTVVSKLTLVPRPLRNGGDVLTKPKPITSIEKLLEQDVPFPRFTPVMLFDRSPWQKFVALFKGRS